MTRFALLCLVSFAACSGSSKPAPDPQPAPPIPDPGPKPSGTPAPSPAVDAARLGTACGDGGTCAPPMECVKYYGIAGAKGGPLSSCEIPCNGAVTCPTGTKCTTIADGPGAVCRQ
jgi:hypothetical protein